MAYKVSHTDSFERDYRTVVDYLTREHGHQSAKRLVMELGNVASILEETPFIRAVSRKPSLERRNLREFFIGSYTLVYAIADEEVLFVRLFHQLQQYDDSWYWDE